MRKSALALVGVLLAGLASVAPAAAPVASAATTGPRVAIIVGATHSVTPTYRSYADQIYAEAIKYTSNVVKVYSPNATASKVKAAVNGASIVVYLGHGNGWPSPYTYDPNYTTKDGFGLNYDSNGDGKLSDSENKYYGEPWIEDLTPAPNAVVLLFHLCYASGNSEPGNPAPTLSVARQRVDNYASAFLRAGARAVIANGHSHDPYYIRALFTTKQTIEQYWRNAPDFHDHVLSYASSRSAGYTYLMDPESAAPASFYRSLTGKLSLTTDEVTGAGYASTGGNPSTFVVPGNASVAVDGAPLYGAAGDPAGAIAPVSTLAAGTRLGIDADAGAAPDGSRLYQVHGLDAELAGYMAGSSLAPRDSLGPRAWTVEDGTGAFSPNDDKVQDAYALRVRLSESAAWRVRIVDADGTKVAEATGTGSTAAIDWAPAKGSVADGRYAWRLHAEDDWQNPPLDADGSLVVDTRAPTLSLVDAEAATVPTFTPNGDGLTDTTRFDAASDEPGWAVASIRNADGTTVASLDAGLANGGATLTWDGRSSSGGYVADGTYDVRIRARDRAGNVSAAQTRTVAAYGSLKGLAASRTLFFPQDGDGLVKATALSFTLRTAATVDWWIQDSAGTVVRTIRSAAALAAGTQSFNWNGRDDAGAFVPRGIYRAVVRATEGTLGATQSVLVRADAFRLSVSDTTPKRGQTITVRITSAEPLSATPVLRIYQPGRDTWKARLTKVSTGVYKASVTLKSGSTGTVRLRVSGYDSGGRKQESSVYLPLH